MTALLWLSRFLLLATLVVNLVLGDSINNDNSFFGVRVADDEAMRFFAELEKSDGK